MRPLMHPALVNGRFGDPAVYVERLFERHAVLFDLGDIAALPPRRIIRIDDVFVSHAHIDHFVGFDRLLRVLVGREKTVKIWGPSGIGERVGHKLQGYQWNLVDRYLNELAFIVTEVDASRATRTVRFRLKNAFIGEELGRGRLDGDLVQAEPMFRVSTAVLDHHGPCLGFAIAETAHLNVWKTCLAALGLPTGSWLRELKRAVAENRPDDHPIRIDARRGGPSSRQMPLGALRDVVTVTAGQKIGYITDVADTPTNRDAIVRLVKGADILFIEAPFAQADVALAAERAHLTTAAAGEIARAAAVSRIEPFHFSARYEGQAARMLGEVEAAFAKPDEAVQSRIRRMTP